MDGREVYRHGSTSYSPPNTLPYHPYARGPGKPIPTRAIYPLPGSRLLYYVTDG